MALSRNDAVGLQITGENESTERWSGLSSVWTGHMGDTRSETWVTLGDALDNRDTHDPAT